MPAPLSTIPATTLDADALDDILYAARTADLSLLTITISTLSTTHKVSTYHILLSAIDNEDDIGTGNTPAHYAAANGAFDVLRWIVEQCSTSGDADAVTVLTRSNYAGSTPLHYAAVNGQEEACRVLVEGVRDMSSRHEQQKETVEKIVVGYVTAKNGAGHNAVFEAERAGKESVVSYLLGACAVETAVGGSESQGDVEHQDEDMAEGNGTG